MKDQPLLYQLGDRVLAMPHRRTGVVAAKWWTPEGHIYTVLSGPRQGYPKEFNVLGIDLSLISRKAR